MNKKYIIIISAIIILLLGGGVTFFFIKSQKPTETITKTPIENTFVFQNRYQLDYSIGATATDTVFESLKTIVLKNQDLDRSEDRIDLTLNEVSIRNHSSNQFYAYSFNLIVQDYQYIVLAQTDLSFGQEYISVATKTLQPSEKDSSYILISPKNISQDIKNTLINQASSILSLTNPTILD